MAFSISLATEVKKSVITVQKTEFTAFSMVRCTVAGNDLRFMVQLPGAVATIGAGNTFTSALVLAVKRVTIDCVIKRVRIITQGTVAI